MTTTAYLDQWIPAKHLKTGLHLRTSNGQIAVTDGDIVPAHHDGWMWDLTVPSVHDFYVQVAATAVLAHNCGGDFPNDPRNYSNAATGRSDASWSSYDRAIDAAKGHAGGDFGADSQRMYDFNPSKPMGEQGTGTLIGEQSADGLRGWRIDNGGSEGGHVNWWDWTGGKKGTGGAFGHDWFPEDPSLPGSRGIGWSQWLDSGGNVVGG